MTALKGGAKLQAALAEISRKVARPATLAVGFLASATYPDGKPVAMIAAIQNWGAPSRGIPPRPFFQLFLDRGNTSWGPALGLNLRAARYDTNLALSRMGEGMVGHLRQAIVDTNSPPLKPATIARKGFATPLIDTGHMLNSADWELRG
jgi:hypothetical protein